MFQYFSIYFFKKMWVNISKTMKEGLTRQEEHERRIVQLWTWTTLQRGKPPRRSIVCFDQLFRLLKVFLPTAPSLLLLLLLPLFTFIPYWNSINKHGEASGGNAQHTAWLQFQHLRRGLTTEEWRENTWEETSSSGNHGCWKH